MQALLYKWLFVFLCLFSGVSFISIAGANVLLGLSALLFLILLFLNKSINVIDDGKKYLKIIAVLACALLVSALCSSNVAQGLKTWADFFIWRLVPFVIVLSMFGSKEKVNRFLIAVISGFVITSLYVIYKGIFVFNGNISYGGASGFVGHPMAFAGLSCVLLPMLYVFIFKEDNKLRLFYSIAFVIGCIATFFNATRGAWLALVIVLMVESVFLSYKNQKIILLFASVVFISLIILVGNQSFVKRASSVGDLKSASVASRLIMWDIALTMFQKNPLLGVGLGQYKYVYQNEYIKPQLEEKRDAMRNLSGFDKLDSSEQELILTSKANIWEIKGLKNLKQVDRRKIRSEYEKLAMPNLLVKLNHAHSNIFQMLAENGIIGLLGYLLTFGAIIWTNIKNYFINKNPHNLMIIGSTIALFLQGLTEYNFGNSSVMKIYWLVLACLVVLVKEYNEERLRE